MTSYTKEHKSSRGYLMMVPVPAHQGNPNVILLEDSPPEVITIADDKNIHGSLLGSSASNIYDAKQFKRLKPKNWKFPGIQYFVAEDSDSFFESYMLWIKMFKLVFDVPFPNPEVEIFNRRKEPFAEMH
ncbi:unnamed protein product [Allacma fusca]|uniref:Uncharacterized protein n=1 Tax=Allacma fusca TaxID=39272 RepID=A0A8J2J3D3_9HEXA|nr:unnamed protein product [Allacma fusca]